MPEGRYKHITIRSKTMFQLDSFKVITRMSHLDEADQSIVRRNVRRSKRPHAKYTVGKLKGGRKIKGRAWKLQKIMVKKS